MEIKDRENLHQEFEKQTGVKKREFPEMYAIWLEEQLQKTSQELYTLKTAQLTKDNSGRGKYQ
jgi:hypothetical protein